MLPCQDTPSVKAPYNAAIRSPLRVLTSGRQLLRQPHDDNTITYYSSQPVPIPSYLITIAAGGTILLVLAKYQTLPTLQLVHGVHYTQNLPSSKIVSMNSQQTRNLSSLSLKSLSFPTSGQLTTFSSFRNRSRMEAWRTPISQR